MTTVLAERQREQSFGSAVRAAVAIGVAIAPERAIAGEHQVIAIGAQAHAAGGRICEILGGVREAVVVPIVEGADVAGAGDDDVPVRVDGQRGDVAGEIVIGKQRDTESAGDAQAEVRDVDEIGGGRRGCRRQQQRESEGWPGMLHGQRSRQREQADGTCAGKGPPS